MILKPVTLRLRGSAAANRCASGQMCTRREEDRETSSFKRLVKDLGMHAHVHKKVFWLAIHITGQVLIYLDHVLVHAN